jgi:hypothetical protein
MMKSSGSQHNGAGMSVYVLNVSDTGTDGLIPGQQAPYHERKSRLQAGQLECRCHVSDTAMAPWEDSAMIVISPACLDDRLSLRADAFADVIMAIGTNRYGEACLDLFGESLDAEHWALFHYRAVRSVSCLATASRMHAAAALDNIGKFVLTHP